MEFAGKTSKYEVGDCVFVADPDGVYHEGSVFCIGILGGKLSNWTFMYNISFFDNYSDVTTSFAEKNVYGVKKEKIKE